MVNATDGGPLSASVLVLNRGYAAIQVVGVRRAVRLLYSDIAEVIHCDRGQFANYDFDSWCELSQLEAEAGLTPSTVSSGERVTGSSHVGEPRHEWVRAVRFDFLVPRVIRLLTFDRFPRSSVHLNRRAVFARDDHRCQYCGSRFPLSQLSLDHVMPRSRGGGTTWDNIVCACRKCNVSKGDRTPKEAGMSLITKPVRPKQSPMLIAKLSNPQYESWKLWITSSPHHIDISHG